MDASSYFKGKKITVTGLGLLGRGVGDVRYLAECGADLIVTDLKDADALAPSLEALNGFPITFVLGEHRLEDFRDRDLIVKGPKTPLDSPFIEAAVSAGIPVTMSTALFARFAREAGARIVGITGTRGKTTTTEMIAHILRTAGKKVLLGGNIRGISTLALLPEVDKETIAVLELDSWQLQGFGAERISPDIAVFTTFMPDHQDYYGGMESYFNDKAEIYRHQRDDDVLVTTPSLASRVTDAPGKVVIAEPYEGELQIPGSHNRVNAGCAGEAARACGVAAPIIASALASFRGVAGRLELIREKDGVRFYNDTTATTPEATLAALSALEGGIVLIMGGSDKGLDMGRLLLEIPKRVKRVIMLPGTGTNRVLPFLSGASVYDSMETAVNEAVRAAASGDAILLSPAFASFGMFQNEYERGDAFSALVQKL